MKLADGRKLHEWIQTTVNGQNVRFRLITSQSGPHVDPFYIMESKVWNALLPGR